MIPFAEADDDLADFSPARSPSYRYPSVMRGSDLIQSAFWPGIPRVESFSYSCSHGISPGVWEIVTAPDESGDDVSPARYGNLVMTDGARSLVLRDCKVDRVDSSTDAGGTTYTIRGFDRRWRWRNQWGGLGGIIGRYNVTDNRGKLVPWTIRSPEELARLCLDEMGEVNFRINLPRGLRKADGANVDRYLRLGENFPQSATNPRVDWYRTPPAEALANLAGMFGCVVVLCPVSNRVLVVPLGSGVSSLPDWPHEARTPGIDDPETPAGVGCWGGPIRIQWKFPIEPVGPEWDESVLPIDDLSFAPDGGPPRAQVSAVTWGGAGGIPYPVNVVLSWGGNTVRLADTQGVDSTATVLGLAAAAGEADANAARDFTFAVAGNTLTVTRNVPGEPFDLTASPLWRNNSVAQPADIATAWKAETSVVAHAGGKTWTFSGPPHFSAVRATDRLTRSDARSNAQRAVFRWFRVMQRDNMPLDPRDRKSQLVLPGFGPVHRVTQLILQPTKVEQVVPQARIAGGTNKGQLLPVVTLPLFGDLTSPEAGILPEFYNGRSRDQKATVTGSIFKAFGYVMWHPGVDQNTKKGDRVYVEFDVFTDDAGYQLIRFAEPVFAVEFVKGKLGYIKYPELTLHTACLVTDPDTDQIVRFERILPIPGGTAPVEWHQHDSDLQIGIIGVEDPEPTTPTGVTSPGGVTPAPAAPPGGLPAQEPVRGVYVVSPLSGGSPYPLRVVIAWTKDGANRTADVSTFGTYPAGTYNTRFSEVAGRIAADPNASVDFTAAVTDDGLTITGTAGFPFAVRVEGMWQASLGAEPADLQASYSGYVFVPGVAASGPGGAATPGRGPAAKPGADTLPAPAYVYAPGDLEHVLPASLAYLKGHARKYELTGRDGRQFVGLYPLDLDGSVPQVTWSGGAGPTTVASLNTEHEYTVLPAPARRRAELLPPNKLAAEANVADNRFFPPVGSPTQ